MSPTPVTIEGLLAAAVEALEALAAIGRAAQVDPLVGPRDMGVSRKTWIRACRSGVLPALRIGRECRAKKSDADAWIASLPSAKTEPKPKKAKVEAPEEIDPLDALLKMRRLRSVGGGKR